MSERRTISFTNMQEASAYYLPDHEDGVLVNADRMNLEIGNKENTSARSHADLEPRKRLILTLCQLSVFAVFGTFCRLLVDFVMTEDPEDVGSLAYLTNHLASNLIGCFILGFFQDSETLNLAVPMSLAWLPPDHVLQSMNWGLFQVGFAATDLSRWNVDMVRLGSSQPPLGMLKAMLGFVVGMQSSIASLMGGMAVARVLHKRVNPILAREREARARKQQEGVFVNERLPDFERRFLAELEMGEGFEHMLPLGQMAPLERWRQTTRDARHLNHRTYERLRRGLH